MAGEITDQQLIDAGTDANNLALIVNGDAAQSAIPLRTGGTARSLRNAAATITKGDPGAPGATGPALPFAGNYANGTTYTLGQIVVEAGVLYASTANNNVGHDPATSSQWSEFGSFPATYPLGLSKYGSQTSIGDSITAGCCPSSARLTGGKFLYSGSSLAALRAVTNGGFSVTINGTLHQITGLNFSTMASNSDLGTISTIVGNALAAAVPGIGFGISNGVISYPTNANPKAFCMLHCGTSLSDFTQTTVGYFGAPASGTDISAMLCMTLATGAATRIADQNFKPWVQVLGEYLGLYPNNVTNLGQSGTTSFQQLSLAYQQVVSTTGRQLFTHATGTNDNFIGGNGVGLDANFALAFTSCLMAIQTWLSMPDEAKYRANTLGLGSGWSASTLGQPYNFGMQGAVGAAPIQKSISGSVIYIGYSVHQAAEGTFTVSIDGQDTGKVYNCTSMQNTGGTSYLGYAQANGQPWAGQLLAIPCKSSGLHDVVITVTSSVGNVYIDWLGGNEFIHSDQGATLLVGGTIRQGIGDPYYDSSTGQCDSIIRAVVRTMRSYGHVVEFVPVRSAQGSEDVTNYLNPDATHPNQEGHFRIAMKYVYAATFLNTTNSVRSDGSDPTLTATSGTAQPGLFTSLAISLAMKIAGVLNAGATFVAGLANNEINFGSDGDDGGVGIISAGGRVTPAYRSAIQVCSYASGSAFTVLASGGDNTYPALSIDGIGNTVLSNRPYFLGGHVIPAAVSYGVDSGQAGNVNPNSKGGLTCDDNNIYHVGKDSAGTVKAAPLFPVSTVSVASDGSLDFSRVAGLGIHVKDTTNGNTYKIQVINGTITATVA